MPGQHPPLSPLDRLWLAETIRLREEHTGPLEDSEANRHAIAGGGRLEDRIERRAMWLAERDGQRPALQHGRHAARLAMLPFALLAVVVGAGLAWSALGDGRTPVNVFWALGSLLGLHVLTLLAWSLGAVFSSRHGGALAHLWIWLSEHLARDAHQVHLFPALMQMLQRHGLTRWGLGLLLHGFWTLLLLSSLVTVLLQFSARQYGFVWETTLLGSETFITLTQALGALPGLIGFPVPDIDAIRASGGSVVTEGSVRQAWAGWLIGLVVVYGVLPRLLLGLFCGWRWHRGKAGLRLDATLPGYALLRERLQPSSERLGVCDAAPEGLPSEAGYAPRDQGEGALLVAIELDGSRPWPPRLPAGVTDGGIIDTREQRRRLLAQMTRFPPARLVVACDPRRSPDRGTLALIGELSRAAEQSRVWLLAPAPGEGLDSDRLQDWHGGLETLGIRYDHSAPLTWLETGND